MDIKIEQLEQLGIEANNAHFATIHDTESVITVCHTTPLPSLRKRLIQHTHTQTASGEFYQNGEFYESQEFYSDPNLEESAARLGV